MMTAEHVKTLVEEVRKYSDDPETAHIMADDVHRDVLKAIAERLCADPAACAAAALETDDIDFPRWYA
jgi:hypothetical protein